MELSGACQILVYGDELIHWTQS